MTAVDVSAKIRNTALAAIERQCFGEDFGFDCSLIVLRDAGGRMVTGYNMVTTCRSPLLGQPPLTNIAQLMSSDPDPAAVETLVTDALRGLREFAAKILKGGPAAPVPAPRPN